ncbi:MAG: GatB/YqeY domain-containing protein [Alphaproteobacteria bacterium]|nr:GatB/YqeY domain-containing protein [Alphaproteobacteria bacterium]
MLREQITETYKQAMHSRDPLAVSAVRLIMAALKDKDINARPRGIDQIPDSEILSMLQAMVKQRRESITLYQQGNRADLVAKEQSEIAMIEKFLPQQMDAAALAAAVEQTVTRVGATAIKDMGKVMNQLKVDYAGQMDFAAAGLLVKQRLGG